MTRFKPDAIGADDPSMKDRKRSLVNVLVSFGQSPRRRKTIRAEITRTDKPSLRKRLGAGAGIGQVEVMDPLAVLGAVEFGVTRLLVL